MKNLILFLAALATIVSVVVFTSKTPAIASPAVVTAAIVSNGNPYLGTSPSSFPMPTVDCPPGNYYVDINCAKACYDKYAQRMFEIYQGAANAYNQSDLRRVSQLIEVDNALNVCLNANPTPAQVEACVQAARAQYNQINAEHQSRVAAIAASVATDSAAALGDFIACAANCCYKDQ